jgi:hypothetical protein
LADPYDPVANSQYRVLDASLYRGQYYLYFGPVPVITLFLPYRLVTGLDLPSRVAVPIFCIAGFLSSCGLFFLLAVHNHWELPFWLQGAVIVALGSMSAVFLILRRPLFYEVAIAAGYCFVMAGFLTLAVAILRCRVAGRWLLLAGLMFGLAAGCRPHLVVVSGIVLGTFAIRTRRSPRLAIVMTTGMVTCGIALGWYNYARFHNPLEFGRTYQLTSFSENPGSTHFPVVLNPGAAFRSAEEFMFLAPHVDTSFPFFHTAIVNPLPGRPGQPIWTEGMIGLIPVAPFALLGCVVPLFRMKRLITVGLLDQVSACLLYAMYWSGITIVIVLCLIGWVIGRYLVDFAPLFTFVGISVIAMFWQTLTGRRIRCLFSWAIGVTAACGAILNVALATPTLNQILEFLRN